MSAGRARRLLVPLIAGLVVVVVAAGVLGVGVARRPFPLTEGELSVAGLTGPVDVLRDERGVAHLYADTPEDLFLGQGYVAAQDRFFQMDLRRHVTSGRLAELVGESGVEADRVIRTMGWRRVAEEEWPRLSPETRRYLTAYTAGVNAYLEENPSSSQVALEYVVLGMQVPDYQIEPWTELDSLTWLKAMAWDLRGNYSEELARARLLGPLSQQKLNALYPPYPYDENAPILGPDEWTAPPPPPAPPPETGDRGQTLERREPAGTQDHRHQVAVVYDDALRTLDVIPPLVGSGEGTGSNSWVVSGEHTESGLPLLANDPHLAVTQPGVWLQTGLHCRVVSEACPFDVSGFSFAGFPGVIIGHNHQVAWGFTNLDPDVTDFYLEDIEGDRVREGDSWVPLTQREEVIEVAGGADQTLTVRETRHGPVLSDVIDEVARAGIDAPLGGVETSTDLEVSMAWTGLQPSRTAEAVFALNAATDWESFRDAARLFAVPSQNLVYADVEGNIGYQAPGLVPIREPYVNGSPPGFWPVPGWPDTYDWRGFVRFSEMPWVLNPPDGVVVTANQAVAQSSTPFLTSEADRGYRAQRISDLLDEAIAAGPLTTETMSAIQNDTYLAFSRTLLPYLLEADLGEDAFYTEPQQLLADWDGTSPTGEGGQPAAAMYYQSVWASILKLTFDDELPEDLWASGGARWMTIMTELLENPEDRWWDDTRTTGVVETRDEILRQAMIDARLDLTRRIGKNPQDWSWSRLHRVPMSHQVFGDVSLPGPVRAVFNAGPHPAPGGSAQVNAFNWDASNRNYQVTSAPSMRMVVDLADLDASRWVDQTGTSGHPFHPHYTDQTPAWLAGDTYPWPHTVDAVRQATVAELTLMPAP